jgi:hypothetical protein
MTAVYLALLILLTLAAVKGGFAHQAARQPKTSEGSPQARATSVEELLYDLERNYVQQLEDLRRQRLDLERDYIQEREAILSGASANISKKI